MPAQMLRHCACLPNAEGRAILPIIPACPFQLAMPLHSSLHAHSCWPWPCSPHCRYAADFQGGTIKVGAAAGSSLAPALHSWVQALAWIPCIGWLLHFCWLRPTKA